MTPLPRLRNEAGDYTWLLGHERNRGKVLHRMRQDPDMDYAHCEMRGMRTKLVYMRLRCAEEGIWEECAPEECAPGAAVQYTRVWWM